MTAESAPGQPDVVVSAARSALVEARWESHDLLSRRSSQFAPDLLRGHAAELATSPLGQDQVLSLALDAAAADLEAGRAPLGDGALAFFAQPAPSRGERAPVHDALRPVADADEGSAAAVVQELERRHGTDDAGPKEIAVRLRAEARLHEMLWDDHRLPAPPATRIAMRASIARLLERADVLDGRDLRAAALEDRAGLQLARAGDDRRAISLPMVLGLAVAVLLAAIAALWSAAGPTAPGRTAVPPEIGRHDR